MKLLEANPEKDSVCPECGKPFPDRFSEGGLCRDCMDSALSCKEQCVECGEWFDNSANVTVLCNDCREAHPEIMREGF